MVIVCNVLRHAVQVVCVNLQVMSYAVILVVWMVNTALIRNKDFAVMMVNMQLMSGQLKW